MEKSYSTKKLHLQFTPRPVLRRKRLAPLLSNFHPLLAQSREKEKSNFPPMIAQPVVPNVCVYVCCLFSSSESKKMKRTYLFPTNRTIFSQACSNTGSLDDWMREVIKVGISSENSDFPSFTKKNVGARRLISE